MSSFEDYVFSIGWRRYSSLLPKFTTQPLLVGLNYLGPSALKGKVPQYDLKHNIRIGSDILFFNSFHVLVYLIVGKIVFQLLLVETPKLGVCTAVGKRPNIFGTLVRSPFLLPDEQDIHPLSFPLFSTHCVDVRVSLALFYCSLCQAPRFSNF